MVFLGVAVSALFLLSYLGGLHPAADAFTVVRFPLAALVLLGLAVPALRVSLPYLAVACLAVSFLLWQGGAWHLIEKPRLAPPTGEGITLYQRNLLYSNVEIPALVEDVARQDPDVITLQEVSRKNAALLDALRADYPYQVYCANPRGGVAVLSRLTPGPEGPVCATPTTPGGAAALNVETSEGQGWIIALHLRWPWPYEQHRQLRDIAPEIAALEGPKILAGDFNAMPWSNAVRRMISTTGARYVGPRRTTFWIGMVPLPLDHVLAGRGSVERLGLAGSDHRGLLARVTFR
ncbi:MAG: endonuclease/exonuclease/phosphatase family protein [Pseudomonadota bacterium]